MESKKDYYEEELNRIKKELPAMSGEDLIDELVLAHKDYESFMRRDDCVSWSLENEKIVSEIYFAIRREILDRLQSNEDE